MTHNDMFVPVLETVGKIGQGETICELNSELRSQLFLKFQEVTRDGYIAVNNTGQIIEINESFCNLLKVTHEEALTKNVLELIPETYMLTSLHNGLTEVDILDSHELGPLKGVDLVCSRSSIEKDGERVIAFAHVRYQDTATAIAKSFLKVSKELEYYKREFKRFSEERYSFEKIIGSSSAIQSVKTKALRAADLDLTVLLQGETGTGKEVFAHSIHNASPRASKPFIRLNCAAIPAELIESELFGYEEGAFSGARKGGKPGKIELADGGTLFLDEIGDMPLPMQAKLLRVLQDQELERLGSTNSKTVNVRVIAATNQDLDERIRENKFRADLYFRLNVINLQLPPLRERPEDIVLLASHFLEELNMRHETHKVLHPSVLQALQGYPWPGNGRELYNAVGHAFSFSEFSVIPKDALPNNILMQKAVRLVGNAEELGLSAMIRELEAGILQDTLEKYGGNYDLAADALKIHKTTLYKKLRKKRQSKKAAKAATGIL